MKFPWRDEHEERTEGARTLHLRKTKPEWTRFVARELGFTRPTQL